jgi:hypothetical protein
LRRALRCHTLSAGAASDSGGSGDTSPQCRSDARSG